MFLQTQERRKEEQKEGSKKNQRRDRSREGEREEGKGSKKILQALFLLSFFYYKTWPMRDYMVPTNTLRRITLKYLLVIIWKWHSKRDELWEFLGNLEVWQQQAMSLGKLSLLHGSSCRREVLKILLAQERQPWKLCSSLKFVFFFLNVAFRLQYSVLQGRYWFNFSPFQGQKKIAN